MARYFEQTYGYKKYIENGKDLNKTLANFYHDIVLSVFTLINIQKDMEENKASLDEFWKKVGEYMPEGATFDGGVSLSLYSYAHICGTLYYNFCDAQYIARMLEISDIEQDFKIYCTKTAKYIYEKEIEKKHFSYVPVVIEQINGIFCGFRRAFSADLPYRIKDGRNTKKQFVSAKLICAVLNCPYEEEIEEKIASPKF